MRTGSARPARPVEFVVIAGARHTFDQDDPKRTYLRGAQRTVENCPLEIDIDTLAASDRNTGQRLWGDAYRDALKSCSALGANVEGSRGAREKAAQAAVAFLRKVFAR